VGQNAHVRDLGFNLATHRLGYLCVECYITIIINIIIIIIIIITIIIIVIIIIDNINPKP